MIYLDHAAATPLDPSVEEAMRKVAQESFANPSSPHAAGRRARAVLEEARERILTALGGRGSGHDRDRLVFTSGATEANWLGVLGTAGVRPGIVACSPRDHTSLLEAVGRLERHGWRAVRVPLDGNGQAAPGITELGGSVIAADSDTIIMATLTATCGQTGLRESLPLLASVSGNPRWRLHVDATQAMAWETMALVDLPATSLAFAPHKFGGPRGIGAVVVRGGVAVAPVMPGPQELGLRGGTEGVALAVGFAEALDRAIARRSTAVAQARRLRDLWERGIIAAAAEHGLELHVVGGHSDRSPHISVFAARGIDRQALVMAADLEGICLGTGTACASGSSEPSPAIVSLGLPEWVADSAVRASLATTTTDQDVLGAIGTMSRLFQRFAGGGLLRATSER